MSRLPTVGSDDGAWGAVLNDFLSVEHNADGTQKTLPVAKGGTGATSAATALTNLGLGTAATHAAGDFLTPSGSGASLTGLTVSQVSGAAPLASPTFSGMPAAPTPSTGDNSTAIATTAFVKAQSYLGTTGNGSGLTGLTVSQVSGAAPAASPTLTGTVDASGALVKVKTTVPLLPTAVSPAGIPLTATFDLTANNRFSVSLSGDTAFSVSGDTGGQPIMIRVVGNGHTVTWWSGITWAGGAAPTLTTGGKADWIYLQRTGTNTYDGGAALANL